MCCLRYEHEFYVQSRKRFPKEGKIVGTAKGEEKILAIDIFRERLTLRNAEGETRVVALADFNREVSDVANGVVPAPDATADEEPVFEVSPELLYTTEYEIPAVRDVIVMEPAAAEPVTPDESDTSRAGDRDDAGLKRRRGRRGGRRG